MARYKHYDYNQLMMVPVSLKDQLMPGTLEYAINHVVEERLDLKFFDERYRNDETGRKAIAPKIGSGGKEIQSNVTDNESAKMATAHGVLQSSHGFLIIVFHHNSPLVKGLIKWVREL